MVLLGLPEPTAPLYHDVFPHGDEVTAEFPKWHSHPMGSRRKKKNVFPKVPMALEKQDLPAGRGDVVSAVARRQAAPKAESHTVHCSGIRPGIRNQLGSQPLTLKCRGPEREALLPAAAWLDVPRADRKDGAACPSGSRPPGANDKVKAQP